MTTKAEREAKAEAADADHTVRLAPEVIEAHEAPHRHERMENWQPPEGHTTQLDPAIVELGDALVVDENLPADGIVESPAPSEVVLSMHYEQGTDKRGPKLTQTDKQDPSAVIEAGAVEVPEPEPHPQAAKAVNPRGSKAAEEPDKPAGRHSKTDQESKTSK